MLTDVGSESRVVVVVESFPLGGLARSVSGRFGGRGSLGLGLLLLLLLHRSRLRSDGSLHP